MNKLSGSVLRTNIKSSTEKCIKTQKIIIFVVWLFIFRLDFLRTLQAPNKRQVVWLQRYKV